MSEPLSTETLLDNLREADPRGFWGDRCHKAADEIERLAARVADLEEQDRQWEKTSLLDIVEKLDRLRVALEKIAAPYIPGVDPIGPLDGAGLARGIQWAGDIARAALGEPK